jgi:hypothetical protein
LFISLAFYFEVALSLCKNSPEFSSHIPFVFLPLTILYNHISILCNCGSAVKSRN